MKNITPEWEVIHTTRVVHPIFGGPGGPIQAPYAVYLLHKGHAVSIKQKHLWNIQAEGPPYTGFICTHCNTPIPEKWMVRWLTMKQFLIPTE